jgi:hypothetical protein
MAQVTYGCVLAVKGAIHSPLLLALNITCANPNGPHMFNHTQDTVHNFFGIVNGFHSLEVARIYPVYPDIQFKQHGI